MTERPPSPSRPDLWKKAPSLTPNQIRGFWASWGGWTLDGMDSFIYALVLTPALTELLPHSGIPAHRQRRLLRQRAAGALSRRLGPLDDLGANRRPIRPRPHLDAHRALLLAVHLPWRGRDQRVAARSVSPPRRDRHRRRVVDGRHVRRRRVARVTAKDGRRLLAHGLLLRRVPRRDRQLHDRRALRLAMDVRVRRHASVVRRLHSLRRRRIRALAEDAARSRVATHDGRGVRNAVLAAIIAAAPS